MSLTALAVVSRQGTPLYLRDYSNTNDLIFNFSGSSNNDDLFDDEIFTNYEESTSKQLSEWPCQLKYQFILNSACEKLEEVLRGNQWRTPGATGMEANWVGLLCLSDNFRAYGESFYSILLQLAGAIVWGVCFKPLEFVTLNSMSIPELLFSLSFS